MKHAVAKFILVFAVFTAVFVLQKPLFMGVHSDAVGVESAYDFLTVAWHGLSMDLAVAGYLTVIPGLAIMVVVYALNVVGDGLRDCLDPRLKK